MNQPKQIVFAGVRYTLISPVKDLGNGISEGPFYSKPGVDPADWAYTPDAGFLAGPATGPDREPTVPSKMHCIQQRAAPATPNPSAS